MSYSEPARTTIRRSPRILVHGLLAVIAAIGAGLGYELLASSASPAASRPEVPRGDHRGALGGDVDNLDPALFDALRQAATDSADDGVKLVVTSGWRSPEHQGQLLQDALAEYGSVEEAARWVATPEASPHVSGDAVDVGPDRAAAWLSANGAAYGLCQIYLNEPWHYELRPDAIDHGCPPMYPDPTHDPRMDQ